MKLHRNLSAAVINGLKAVLIDGKQADVTVEQLLLSNRSWGSRDRNFIAGNIYTIIRYKRLYEFCTQVEAIDEPSLWKMFGARLVLENVELPEWEELAGISVEEVTTRNTQAQSIRKIRESIPDWLDELGEKELGDKWEAEIQALNTPAQFSIRVNTLQANKRRIVGLFTRDQIPFRQIPEAGNALVIEKKVNFKNYEAYKAGLFEIQDVSSQLVAPMLHLSEGMQVIDACAGAGGKTLHIAALMNNKGDVLAMDLEENKLKELNKRAQRAGADIINTAIASAGTIDKLRGTADRLLLDVPCSGLGVLRRKPDAKWQLTPEFLKNIQQTQANILDEYTSMLKEDGILVYSTCSILPAENEEQVKEFIERRKGEFELMEEKRISATTGFDGFYMAKLRKTSGS